MQNVAKPTGLLQIAALSRVHRDAQAALQNSATGCWLRAQVAWAHDARGALASGSRDGMIALWQVYPPAAAAG